MSWARASLSLTPQSQVLDAFLAEHAEGALRVEVGVVWWLEFSTKCTKQLLVDWSGVGAHWTLFENCLKTV